MSAVSDRHTINSQKSLFLVIGTRFKLGDDLQTMISGDFGHLKQIKLLPVKPVGPFRNMYILDTYQFV